MTVVVLSSRSGLARRHVDNVVFVPVRSGWRGWVALPSALARIHREEPIDVITTQRVFAEAWIALVFARLTNCRVVGQVHSDLTPLVGRARQLTRALLPRFHTLRVVSTAVKEQLEAAGWHHRVRVVPVSVTAPLRIDAWVTSTPREPEVLFVGRLVPEKDIGTWLRIAQRVLESRPDVRFTIIGDGPLRASLESDAKALGVAGQVRFRGAVAHEELDVLYRRATVLLLTSTSEGFGRVLVEAALAATPAVGSQVGGIPDVVVDGVTGLLHPAGDIDGMAASVRRLLDDAALRTRLGNAARARAEERFSSGRLRREWIDLLLSARRAQLDPWQVLPKRRTVARWRSLASSRYSALRWLEYDAIAGLELRGRVLDLGGGRRNSYVHMLRTPGVITSVNLDRNIGPSVVADLNAPLPFRSRTFDAVVSLNTFEHLQHDTVAIAEALRVLRTGGRFHFVVPFLYRVHGSPQDFHRHTAEWWHAVLVEHGVAEDELRVEPLVWDRVVSAQSLLGTTALHRLVRAALALRAVVADVARRGDRLSDLPAHRRLTECALGYHIHGTR
jgi:glycosyltransferase involved in cell wall biosynthesis/SAM-dependent methyltransferase